jgi:methylphosphotriester-DNA--protein-cysteine methyltransferase
MANTGKRYTEEQIIAILKEAESAKSAAEVIRRHGVTAHTFYRWKAKFAGMEVSESRAAVRHAEAREALARPREHDGLMFFSCQIQTHDHIIRSEAAVRSVHEFPPLVSWWTRGGIAHRMRAVASFKHL